MDIKLVLKNIGVRRYYDFDIENGDFKKTDDISTAILMSIFCEQRDDSIEIPEKRGGWIGNELNDNFQQGSRLWTKYQSKIDDETASDIEEIIKDCLQWMIDDGILQDVEVETTTSGNEINTKIIYTLENQSYEIIINDILNQN